MGDNMTPKSTAMVLRNASSTTDETTKEIKEVIDQSVKKQSEAIDKSSKEILSINERVRRTPSERASHRIAEYLNIYKNMEYSSPERAKAMQKILDIVMQFPSKSILDTILKFFIENKDQDFLDPINALQGIAVLDKTSNIRVRLLYTVFYKIATRTATRETISIEMLRTMFSNQKNDTFITWVATKLPRK